MSNKRNLSKDEPPRGHSQAREHKKIRGEYMLPVGDSIEDSIKAFLHTNSRDLGEVPDPENLKIIQEVSTPTRKVVRFQQQQNNIPVLYTNIVVQLDKSNRIKQVDLGHTSNTNIIQPSADRNISPEEAIKYASESLGSFTLRKKPVAPIQVYYPTPNGLKLAYQVLILTREPEHDWQIIVDAYTGDVLEKKDLIFHIDGQGLVFDPNPVVTANNNTYRDPDAVASTCGFSGTSRATIDAERVTRTLRDITFSGGTHKLEGPFVKLRNFGTPNIAPPEEANANDFNYSSGDPRFEAVMVYYHVDTIQRYIQSLGITTAHNSQIEADAHDETGGGGAFFSPGDRGIHFGSSGTCRPDRAEDGDVMLHEYGHAIQNNQVPGWGVTNPVTGRAETRAMGEGFGDILACVFFAEMAGGFQREVFEDWIFGDVAGLRRVDGTKVYPADWVNQEHGDGEIWSAALWNIYRTIGGDSSITSDRQAARYTLLKSLILSHHRLAADASMPEGAEAIMEENAELDDFHGRNLMEMLNSFHDRGLLVCSPQADLYIREASDDPGVDNYVGPVFWNSPDLWIRNADDGGTTHQNPESGQDNWFYARVTNRGSVSARAFVVTFNVKPWAGTQFVYPTDFVPYISAVVGFDLAPGDSTIVKAKWPSSLMPPAGTHGCLLASVYTPIDVSPSGKHVWEHNNLAQKNLTVVDLAPNDSVVIPFHLGNINLLEPGAYRIEVRRPQKWTSLPVSIVHKDPEILKKLFNSTEVTQGIETATHAGMPVIKPKSVLRFLEPARIEILHSGTRIEPVRLNLGKDSSMDIGKEEESSTLLTTANTKFSDKDREASLVQHKPTIANNSLGETTSTNITFHPGVLAGFPIALKPRNEIQVGLKITAPADAKSGDSMEMQVVQRNAKGEIVGGITVQVNIK
jgi:hypothetical protein